MQLPWLAASCFSSYYYAVAWSGQLKWLCATFWVWFHLEQITTNSIPPVCLPYLDYFMFSCGPCKGTYQRTLSRQIHQNLRSGQRPTEIISIHVTLGVYSLRSEFRYSFDHFCQKILTKLPGFWQVLLQIPRGHAPKCWDHTGMRCKKCLLK
jgi:hypothetical protein